MHRLALALLLASTAARADCPAEKPYDRASLHAQLAALAAPDLDGRAPGSDGDRAARALIEARLTCSGLTVHSQPFTAQNGADTANLWAILPGTDLAGEIVLVTAHFDHLGAGFLGANDNASGVTGVLAIAQDLATSKHRRTIVFALFGDEETGMTGSYFFAAHLPPELAGTIVQDVNLDMIGSHASRGFVAAMGTFRGFAATKLLAKLTPRYRSINVATGGRARGSDFEPFCKQGVPYVFFWTPDAKCYHAKCDTLARIDERHMADIAALAGDLVRSLADTDLDLAATNRRLGCGAKYD